MIGLLGSISKNSSLDFKEYDYFGNRAFLENEYKHHSFSIKRKLNSKFSNDKLFNELDDIFFAVDGTIFNLKQLRDSYAKKSTLELFRFLFAKLGRDFIKEFKGDFSLVVYDKKNGELTVYTDINTTKPIYYYEDVATNEFYFASNSYNLYQILADRGITFTVNKFAFYSVASFGYVFGDWHFTNEIKKLRGGTYVTFKNKAVVHKFWELSSFPQLQLSENEYLRQIQERFTAAVTLQYQKDEEYGYRHLSTLSGGLDSRMTTIVGKEIGFKNIDTITFSSAGYWDEIIAKDISHSYHLKNCTYRLFDGKHLEKYDYSLHLNGGMLSYYVASQMHDLYSTIDFETYGLLHTGQVGDAIIGSTLHKYPNHFKFGYASPHYREHYVLKLEKAIMEEFDKNDSLEISKFKNHVENFTMQGIQYVYPFTESSSPFLDKDVLGFCLRIPLQYRNNHNLYYKWIQRYYPKAGTFFYEKTKKRTLQFGNKYVNKAYNEFFKAYLRTKGLKDKNNALLNFQDWGKSSALGNRINEVFNAHIENITSDDLRDDLKKQFNTTNFGHKLKALHAVLIYNMYFPKK